jgi:hypothetical protein
MTKDQISQRLEDIVATINKAHDDVSAGIIQDLSFMDKDVASVCNDIVKLKPEEAAEIQPIMADMISRLEGLAQSLQSFKSQFDQG